MSACATNPQIPAEVADIRSRAARGVRALAVRYGLVVGLNAAGTIVVSRLLGPHVWGIYAVGQFLYMAANEVFGRGIPAFLIRSPEYPNRQDLRAVFALQNAVAIGFAALIAAAACVVGRSFGIADVRLVLAAAAVACLLYACRTVPVAMLERQLQFGKLALIEITDALVFNLVAIALATLTHSVTALVVALVLRSLIPTVLVYPVAHMTPSLGSWESDGIRRIARFGLSYAGASVLGMTAMAVPPFLLGPLAGSTALGYVQMSAALYSTLLFATAAVLRVSFSAYSRLLQWPDQLEKSIEENLTLLAALQLPLIVIFAGLSPIWIHMILGARWTPMSAVIFLHAPGYFMAAVFWGVLSSALFVTGRGRFVLCWLACFTVGYAGLTVLLWMTTKSWLAAGAAWSLCQLLGTPILLYGYAKKRSGTLARLLLPLIGAAAATLTTVWLLMSSGRRVEAAILIAAFALLWAVWHRNRWLALCRYMRSV